MLYLGLDWQFCNVTGVFPVLFLPLSPVELGPSWSQN